MHNGRKRTFSILLLSNYLLEIHEIPAHQVLPKNKHNFTVLSFKWHKDWKSSNYTNNDIIKIRHLLVFKHNFS